MPAKKKTPAKKKALAKKKKAPAKKKATPKKKKAPAKPKASSTKKPPATKQASSTKKAPAPRKAPADATRPDAAAATTPTRGPSVGQPAPAFELPGDDGATHSLAAHRGSPVVIYFYPKDDTPGCTIEACDFRDNLARVAGRGAVVLGISKDTTDSHARFRQKYSLNFPLLSDPELTTHKAYGAWGDKLMYGKPTVGVIRSTFLVGKDGRIARAWPKVKVDGHVDDVLRALDSLG